MKAKHFLCAVACTMACTAQATVVSFDLNPGGYTQDSPVATDLFAASGLTLSSGVITACGGECISNPAGAYTGSITGDFMGNAYAVLQFIGVTGSATIDLFDLSDNLVTTLSTSGSVYMPDFEGGFTAPTYAYSGATGIASWTAHLNYDGLIQLSFDEQVNGVPEPASLALLALGLAGIGIGRFRKA